jgi:hypothetical protein
LAFAATQTHRKALAVRFPHLAIFASLSS